MSVTVVTTNKNSPWYVGSVGVTGHFVLVWDETTNAETNIHTLNWTLKMIVESTSPGNYARSCSTYADGINIDGHTYTIPAKDVSTIQQDKTVTSGTTVIKGSEDGTKYINVSVTGKIGGELVKGSVSNFALTKINVDIKPSPKDVTYLTEYNGKTTPVLYSPGTTDFTTNGLGRLVDCAECKVTEELNGSYELTMRIPTDSAMFNLIQHGSLIGVLVNRNSNSRQAFEVYEIEKDIDNIARIRAWHVSYRLRYIPVKPFTSKGVNDFLSKIKSNSIVENPFTFSSTIENTTKNVQTYSILSAKSLCGPDWLLTDFGGELEWDNLAVKHSLHRGVDRGVEIRYAKNLTDITATDDSSNVTNAILPFWVNPRTNAITYGDIQRIEETSKYGYDKLSNLDFSDAFASTPTKAQLNDKAKKWLDEAKTNKLNQSINIGYQDLSATVNGRLYKDIPPEIILLGDTISIIDTKINVSVKAEVTKIEYDVINSKILDLTIGEPKEYVTSRIVNNLNEIERIDNERKKYERESDIKFEDMETTVQEAVDAAEAARKEAQEKADQARAEAEAAKKAAQDAMASTVTSNTPHYLATTKAYGVQITDSGWTIAEQTISLDYPYLWLYRTIIYGDGRTVNEGPWLSGVYGATGPAGPPGAAGISSYTHIKYSKNVDGTGFVNAPTSETIYIGVYTGSSSTAPLNKESYVWSRYVGAQGDKGDKGDTGAAGNGINSITYYYKVTTTQTQPTAASITLTSPPSLDPINKYLWQKEVIDFTDTAVQDKTTVTLLAAYGDTGAKGDDGTIGKDGSTFWNTTVAPATPNYTFTKTNLTGDSGRDVAVGDFIFYSYYRYAVDRVDSTTVHCTARQSIRGATGASGTSVTITNTSITYQASSSGTVTPTGTWQTSVPSLQNGQYLWTKTEVTYSTGTKTTSYSVAYKGIDGAKGDKGDQGNPGTPGKDGKDAVSIVGLDELYYCSSYSTIPNRPTAHVTAASATLYNAWNLLIPKFTKTTPYYYRCVEILYSDGSYGWSQPVADVQLEQSMATAVTDISTQYYVSTSNTEVTGGSWLSDYNSAIEKANENARKRDHNENLEPGENPEVITEFYIWARSKTTYVNDDIVYGTPYLNDSLKTTVDATARVNIREDRIELNVSGVTTTINENDASVREWVETNYSTLTSTQDSISAHFEDTIKGYISDQNELYLNKATGEFAAYTDGFKQTFTKEVIDPLKSDVDNSKATLETYSSFMDYNASTNTITLGNSDSDIQMELDNDSLDFVNKSQERKAWVDANDGLGASALSLGNSQDVSKRWNFKVSDDGKHLSITRHS